MCGFIQCIPPFLEYALISDSNGIIRERTLEENLSTCQCPTPNQPSRPRSTIADSWIIRSLQWLSTAATSGEWQDRLRPKVRELVGLPDGDRIPLNPFSIWKRDHPHGTIEKIVFSSEPGSDVVAFLCLPKDASPPYPFFICVQGHTTGMHHSIAVERDDNNVPMEVAGDREFGLQCMERGIGALCIEQRSFGERRELVQEQVSTHGCHDAAMHALMLGRTLIGERVFDVDRGLDYLATRDDVDWSRIGIMGNSGGGTISLFSAALLPRITHAMPSCYFNTFRDSIMSIYHCADNYVPGSASIRRDGRRYGTLRAALSRSGLRRGRIRYSRLMRRVAPSQICKRSTERQVPPIVVT